MTESASHSLFRVREAKGISQERMAELLGLHAVTYQRYERGRWVPPPARWRTIKQRLDELERSAVSGRRKYQRPSVREVLEGGRLAGRPFELWPKRMKEVQCEGKIAVGIVFDDGAVAIRWLRASGVTPRGSIPSTEAIHSADDLRVRLLAADVELKWRA